jgi:hypothetical protein
VILQLRIPLKTNPVMVVSAGVMSLWFLANYSAAIATLVQLRRFVVDVMLAGGMVVEP